MKFPVFLRLPQVIARTSFSKSTINRRVKEGRFPQKHKLENCVFWYEHELEEWMRDPSNYSVKKGGKKNES